MLVTIRVPEQTVTYQTKANGDVLADTEVLIAYELGRVLDYTIVGFQKEDNDDTRTTTNSGE